jgi:hypothetical protein
MGTLRPRDRPWVLVLGVAAFATGLVIAVAGRASAPAGRYRVANGTVYDTKTRLTWQQTASSSTYVQADAASYCATLSLSGASWRLPTGKELITLVDVSVAYPEPTIDSTAFPGTPADYFWSMTPFEGTPGNAWAVSFNYGGPDGYYVSALHYARCVH